MSHYSAIKKAACDTSADGKTNSSRQKEKGYKHIIAETAGKVKKDHCIHPDCIYRQNKKDAPYGCDYLSITGRSRLAWHIQKGLSDKVEDCQLYKSTGKPASWRKGIVISKASREKKKGYEKDLQQLPENED